MTNHLVNFLNNVYGSFDPWSPAQADLDLALAKTLWKIDPWEHWREDIVATYDEELFIVRQLQNACIDCLTKTTLLSDHDMMSYCYALIKYSRLPEHIKKLLSSWLSVSNLSITKILTRVLGLILCYISAPCAFDNLL